MRIPKGKLYIVNGQIVNEKMIIEQPTKWLRWLYPSAIWRMNPTEKAVYLTFDDGPIPESTPWLIETLDR